MAAPLVEEMARRLDASPQQAQQALQTLLAEIKTTVERDGQALVPGLGVFRQTNGHLTFEPDEALSQYVNQSFAGLDPVNVPADPAASPPPAEESSARASPMEAEKDSTEKTTEKTPDQWALSNESPFEKSALEEEAPEGVFPDQSPSPEDKAHPEESSGESSNFSIESPISRMFGTLDEGTEAPEEQSAEQTLPEEPTEEEPLSRAFAAPGSQGRSLPSWTYAALPAGYLICRHAPPAPNGLLSGTLRPLDQAAPRAARSGDRPPSVRPAVISETSSSPEITSPDSTASPETTSPRTASTSTSTQRRDRSPLSWIAALVVLLAVGLGAWYALGRQGVVPGPVAALGGSSSAEEQPPEEVASPTPEPTPPATTAEEPSETTPPGDEAASSSDESTSETPASEPPSEPASIDRAAGGWTVVVSSKISRAEAQQALQRFAERYSNRAYPIDILSAATDDGTTRHRVAVGQFSSREQALSTLQGSDTSFPEGAWILEITPEE